MMQFLLVWALEFFMAPYISITLCKTDLTKYDFVTLIILRAVMTRWGTKKILHHIMISSTTVHSSQLIQTNVSTNMAIK